jgi:pimeloyl-ACP methyl ester carboxylesterase
MLIGYDSYWHPAIKPEQYSFVDFALNKGYSIFYYDRVSTGKSEVVPGIFASVYNQAHILAGIIKQVKGGRLPQPASSKIVVVGHSVGSGVSNGLLAINPELADAAVLTGVSYYGLDSAATMQSKQSRIANLINPKKWGHLDSFYTSWVDKWSNAEAYV